MLPIPVDDLDAVIVEVSVEHAVLVRERGGHLCQRGERDGDKGKNRCHSVRTKTKG